MKSKAQRSSSKKNDGYVYVLTNVFLEELNIFKIGYSTDINDRIAYINSTRYKDEYMYIKCLYSSSHAKQLVRKIHTKLRKHNDNGGFFRCELDTIKNQFKDELCEIIDEFTIDMINLESC